MSDRQAIATLEAALENTAPLTEDEVGRSLRILSRRAWEATGEHNRICVALGEAHAIAEKQYWDALIVSHEEHADRRVGHHEAVAKQASLDSAALVQSLTLMERSLRKEMEILEKLVSALQTQAKGLREAA